jgi:DNA-binding NtrC family response regulator
MVGGSILVVEDEDLQRKLMVRALRQEGHQVVEAADAPAARKVIDSQLVDLVFLDLGLGADDRQGQRGQELFEYLQKVAPEVPVVIATAHDSAELAVGLVRRGAYHYVVKPIAPETLADLARTGLQLSAARRDLGTLKEISRKGQHTQWYVGQTPRMQAVEGVVDRFAPTDAGLLIEGESGTGKEIVALALHERSPRRDGPFVPLNCSAVPRELFESEMFGHEKGAFTGAIGLKRGLLELAHGGTLFLDELTEMPAEMQAKLLRALQEFKFRRVGGSQEIKVDVRVVSATNVKVAAAIRDGTFRHDLFYRLCVMSLELPPLRERAVDIPYFVELFVSEFRERMGTSVVGLTDNAMWALLRYEWPGNIRELRNAVERGMIMAMGEERIHVTHLPDVVRGIRAADDIDAADCQGRGLPADLPPDGLDLKAVRDSWERGLVEEALRRTDGNQSAAARLLALTRDELRYRVEKFELASE